MLVKYYKPPDGRFTEIDMKNITQADEEYFVKHNYELSIEEILGNIVVYARAPHDHDGEQEVIVLAGGRSCEETMTELAEESRKVYGLL